MKNTKILVSLVALLAFALFAANVSALGSFQNIEVNNVDALSGTDIAVFAGEQIPVEVTFSTMEDARDVRVRVWISGSKDYSFTSERFDVIAGKVYNRVVYVTVPYDIDPSEDLSLEVSVESKNNGRIGPVSLDLAAQRESYEVQVLDVFAANKVQAGESLALDVVLKNRGRQLAEDTFVTVRIPSLGIERRSYFGDLSAVDQSDPDKEDAVERRMYLEIPSNVPAGIYSVEIEAFNADSVTTVVKKLAIVGASESSMVVSSSTAKTFNVGEAGSYTVTLVNSGNNVRVYELIFDLPQGLDVSADETVVAVPAGSSRTVKFDVMADEAGKYSFAANVHSDGELVDKETFSANVEGTTTAGFNANATVILTVVLAIIFVVLLVVLIVLLTRKPQKNEEFGESYY